MCEQTMPAIVDEAVQVHMKLYPDGHWSVVYWWRSLSQDWTSRRCERIDGLTWGEGATVVDDAVRLLLIRSENAGFEQTRLDLFDDDPF